MSTLSTLLALPTRVKFLPLVKIIGATLVVVSVMLVAAMVLLGVWILFLLASVRVTRDRGERLLEYLRELHLWTIGATFVPTTVVHVRVAAGWTLAWLAVRACS